MHTESYPRGYCLSGERFLNHEMGLVASGGNNAQAQDLGDDFGGLVRTVHPIVGKLVGRETLRVKRAKTGFVAKQRAAGHGHATRKENLDGGIEPKNGNTGSAQKIRASWLRVGPATEG